MSLATVGNDKQEKQSNSRLSNSNARSGGNISEFAAKGDDVADLNPCSYILYYLLLFFAYWFGAARFDMDGDGDFDPEDVQAFLEQKGFVSKNFKKNRKSKRKSQSEAQAAQAKAQAKAKAKAKAEPGKEGGGGLFDFDQNGDGQIDMKDILESHVAGGGQAAEDKMLSGLMDANPQRKPWFMIIQCTVCFLLWAVNAYRKSMDEGGEALSLKAGLDTFQDGFFDLKLFDKDCNDLRGEAWRYLTYQFTHIGVMHVTMNCFLNVMLGIPLEGMHGPIRMFIMFNVGVLGGACCFFVNNPFETVVGMSGGCYALIGMHFADLIMNWHQKKFRKPTLFFILALAGADIGSYMLTMSSENASHSAHVGGAIAGLLIGVMIGENMEVRAIERVLQVICTILGLGLVGFCMAWNYTTWPPTDIWGSTGYCWYRQAWLEEVNMPAWQCVRCGTQECINSYMDEDKQPNAWQVRPVSFTACNEAGWDCDTEAWSGCDAASRWPTTTSTVL